MDPAALFRSVSDASRLRLLRLLAQEELNVQELVAITRLSQPRVSKHLGILRGQGWLRQRKEGTWSWQRTVAPENFPAGPDVFAQVLQVSALVPEAAVDDARLQGILADRRARTRDFFAGIADRWDLIRTRYEHPDIRLGVLGGLVDPRLKVLDIGTGTGAMLPVLGAAADLMIALDNSESMLARARALCLGAGLDRVRFTRADVARLPFADGAFDACCCSMVLHHVARPGQAVGEMARVLGPGGRLMITAFCRHRQEWMREELAHQWLGFDRAEIEAYLLEADLEPVGYLVRGRSPAPGAGTAGDHDGGLVQWPDVFLSTARKKDR